MRRLLLFAHRVPVQGNFTLNDLAGGAGRMDEVARSVSTAFTLSNGLRRDLEMTVLFVAEPPPASRRLRVSGLRLRHLHPDERSTAALLKNALVRSLSHPGEVESSPGLTVGPVDPLAALREFAGTPGAVWLTESGGPISAARLDPAHGSAVLSDDTELSAAEAAILVEAGVTRVSLGPRVLRASQAIDVFLNELDRREAPAPS